MIYSQPPKLPYRHVFILVNLPPYFSGHQQPFPAKLGALDSFGLIFRRSGYYHHTYSLNH
jgi:hypothetical protein